jgi:citrate synthase
VAQELTAIEAAARLGVKRETVYAYVSRGLLHRRMAMDGRTSLFDADEIAEFRSSRHTTLEGRLDTPITTALTRVADGQLSIRGRDVVRMLEDGLAYEDVVDCLWSDAGASWEVPEEVARAVAAAQGGLPGAAPLIARLRVSAAVASAADPLRNDQSASGIRLAGRMLLGAMVVGLPPVGTAGGAGVASSLWPRLTSEPASHARCRVLDAALVLLADHGMATSTFAVRLAASVRADPYSVVITGLGVVGGALHGAASRDVHDLLAEADARGDTLRAVGDTQRRSGRLPGFGHQVYRTEDPRYTALMGQVNDVWGGDPRLGTVHAVRDLVGRRSDAIPNVDLALGALTWLAGMPPDAGEAIFAIARTGGWIAHALEEYQEPPLRFRPRARYEGPM